jgi:hypothetical protein
MATLVAIFIFCNKWLWIHMNTYYILIHISG